MPTHDTETLAEVLAAHEFTSTSSSRNGINTHHAGCACGIGFDWYERDAQHRDHLFAVVAAQAKAEALAPVLALAEQWEQDGGAEPFAWEALRAASSVPQTTEPTGDGS